MYNSNRSVVACVTSQYECDRIIETAEQLARELDCELHVLSVLMPTENYALISDQLEYLNRVSKDAGADMTIIFSSHAPEAAVKFVNENNAVRIVTGLHDGGHESFLVRFNRMAPEMSITMVDKDRNVYTMDVHSSCTV